MKSSAFLRSLLPMFLAASTLLGQWRDSPFPSTTPAVGYTIREAFVGVNLNITGSFRPVNFSTHNGRLFIVSKHGHVLLMTNATSTPIVFINNTADIFSVSDAGLIGFAMHPNGQTCYTFCNETNRTAQHVSMTLRKWTVDPANPNRVLPGSRVLLEQVDEHVWHAGGDLAFGPDGYLYASVGDEGGLRCGYFNCQTISKDHFSGILRIDVDGRPGNLPPNPHPAVRSGYWIPHDNPWVGATSFNGSAVDPAKVRTEFWAVGLRNPWKLTFDGPNLYAMDVGESRWEEVNRIVRGGNYGWNWREGNEVTTFPEAPPAASRPSVTFNPPLWTYPHASIVPVGGDTRFSGNCIAGGFVYHGTRYPRLDGKLICGDLVSGNVWAISLTTPPVVEQIANAGIRMTGFGLDPHSGDILIAEFDSRKVFKLVPVSDPPNVPGTLSATGVFQNMSTLNPASGVLPYEVANPFWSDHAVKSRWFFMPPGQKIARNASDEWTFPTGTVWVKHFDLPLVRGGSATRRVETRFTVKTTDGLYGLTYRWRADGSDADLVPTSGVDVLYPVEDSGVAFNQPWHYPSRGECATCHNPSSGYVLGFSTRQLNVPVTVTGGTLVNQLLGFSSLGVFAQPFSTVDGLPRLSRPNDESFSLEHRVKSYTDANCAYCHRPDGGTRSAWDGRFSTPMASSHILGEAVIDDLQIPGSQIIAPGDIQRSVMYRRVADFVGHQVPESYHMPPLATYQRNDAAVSLLERYITSLVGRTVWQIGTDNLTSENPYAPHAEFSTENSKNDAAPGVVTRVPGDPQYNPATNPSRDDDFYFAGVYPAGFNGLTAPLTVPYDEPPAAWERAHTPTDLANRIHFILAPGQVAATTGFRLSMEFVRGSTTVIDGVTLPGIGQHDMVIRFRNGVGVVTPLYSQRITQMGLVQVDFTAAMVQATAGANTIEVMRTGPLGSAVTAWILYDYLRLEIVGGPVETPNIPPVLAQPSNRVLDELTTLSFNLQATDADNPPQILTYSLVTGPSGMQVSAGGLLTWTPTEAQGPGVYTVEVRVTDNGAPALSDTRQFTVTVNEVPDPEVPNPVTRTLWQIGISDKKHVEFSVENAKEDAVPGTLGADDDFYTAGTYPAGFNGLSTALVVAEDEPWTHWERAHTQRDPLNRLHFVATSGPAVLNIAWANAGWASNGVVQSGVLSHEFRIQHVGGGTTTTLFQGTVPQLSTLNLPFTAANGANSIIIQRTGPPYPTTINSWLLYDSVRISK